MQIEDIISQVLKDNKKPSTIFIDTDIESTQPEFVGLPLHYLFHPMIYIKSDAKEYSYIIEIGHEGPCEESSRVYSQIRALEIAIQLTEEFKKNSKKTKVKINDLLPEQIEEIINLYSDELARIACEFGGYPY